MKQRNPLGLLSAWLALALTPGHAAQAAGAPVNASFPQSGTISGRVQNVVTGKYLTNARVSVKGTNLTVLTDEFGAYRLVNVLSGPIVLEVFYTDLDRQEIPLNVPPGGGIEQHIDLTSKARYGQNLEAVKLDPFVVSSHRETDGQALALNEQRFAPNIKNVIATDTFGDILGSNVGEFLKFLPGLTAEYSASGAIDSVSLRGIGGDKTAFTTDGAPMVTAIPGGDRTFYVFAMALTSTSRVEVTKVPTPSTPADSLAGSVNMVSRSAFEASRAQFVGGINLVMNSENFTLKTTPHTNGDKNTRKIRPGFDFNYTLPINRQFGIVLTGMQSDRFSEQHLSTTTYNAAGTATGASFSKPFLQTYSLADGPHSLRRTDFSAKADWRVTPNAVLSFGAQYNRYGIYIGTNSWTMNAGTIGTPTPVAGVPLSFGDGFTTGATGRGAVTISGGAQTIYGGTDSANLNYRFDDGRWKITTGINYSTTSRERPETDYFSSISSSLINPSRVSFTGIIPDRPGGIQAFGNDNREIDIYNPSNYQFGTATEAPYDTTSIIKSANLNVRRRFSFLPFPTALQGGGYRSVLTVDSRQNSRGWTYAGPDGITTTPDTPVPYLMQIYRGQDSHFGFKNVPFTSTDRAYAAFKSSPGWFVQTPAQAVAQENYRRTNSKFIQETVSALYLQAEASLFQNRLNVLTGVRFEQTTDDGEGSLLDADAVFVRNADGSFARTPAGARIRRADAGTVGSIEELRLTRQERAFRGMRTYDGYYPSVHFTYAIKENFLARLAYARSYGRPNFVDVIPNATISQRDLTQEQMDDPTVIRGTITVANTALRPWTADNYDLSLEYYTEQGGLFSAGVFKKEIKNFFGSAVRLATAADLEEVGLDSRYVGWNLSTKFNAGNARITGAEFNARHSLRPLGAWGSYFTVFANASKLRLEGNRQADFTSFIPLSGNWGFSFSRRQLVFMAKWNHRGLDRRAAQAAAGPDAYQYIKARTFLDMNAAYQLTKKWSVSASVGNIFNVPQTLLLYGPATPGYARQFRNTNSGVTFGVGIRAAF
ncbi:MAG: TonB-dependent receptor [Verrucomicrobia bacterium]|nr:TonB-dependent receptor [Verrucomicrobiota bacterium]